MRYLGAADLRRTLGMADAISATRDAFDNDREIPRRILLGPSLFMPGRIGTMTGIKVVSVSPGDPAGIVVVFDDRGAPLGLVDGPTLTAIRTGAAAGLATRLLAPNDATTMAMLGAGAMAADQIEAVRTVRPIERVLIWSRHRAHAEQLAETVGADVVDDPNDAVRQADIVTTATPATHPLFDPDAVIPPLHINAIGAFTPDMVEVPPGIVRRSFVVVDDIEAASREAGDLIQAQRAPDATIGDVLAGVPRGNSPITLFKSVGIASQDIAVARAALKLAAASGIGVMLDPPPALANEHP